MRALHTKGSMLVEVVIGAAIILVLTLALSSAFSAYLKLALSDTKKMQAISLAEEGVEAVRYMRDLSWINFSSSPSTFFIYFNGSTWVATTSINYLYVDSYFARTVSIAPVYRDGSHKIAPSGTPDANTKKVTVSVSWKEAGATTTKILSTYFSNIYD